MKVNPSITNFVKGSKRQFVQRANSAVCCTDSVNMINICSVSISQQCTLRQYCGANGETKRQGRTFHLMKFLCLNLFVSCTCENTFSQLQIFTQFNQSAIVLRFLTKTNSSFFQFSHFLIFCHFSAFFVKNLFFVIFWDLKRKSLFFGLICLGLGN